MTGTELRLVLHVSSSFLLSNLEGTSHPNGEIIQIENMEQHGRRIGRIRQSAENTRDKFRLKSASVGTGVADVRLVPEECSTRVSLKAHDLLR